MQIAVLRELMEGEQRVALTPESVKKLVRMKCAVAVEAGAGAQAGADDASYREAGATVVADADAALAGAELLVAVNRPPQEVLGRLRSGMVLLSFQDALTSPAAMRQLAAQGVTTLAMELVPRITRAQAMDALSSLATVVGYKAVLLAATRLPRMFPLLMTAAGTVPPAKVLVIGAGVAGLQAIATARRLGARVEAYDVRAAAGEQVKSLGASFLEVDLGGIETQDAGGYAKELSEEALDRGRRLVAEHAQAADVIITTAQVPGRKAPLMLLPEGVRAMKPGSVIVDLAGASGGNCPLTRPGESYTTEEGVVIMSPLNLAASVPVHASQLYSRNVTSFLEILVKDGALRLDPADEIVAGACVTRDGQITHDRVRAAAEKEGMR